MLLAKHNMKQAFPTVDLNVAGAVGERISLAKSDKVAVVVSLGASATGAITQITLRQHDAAVAGVSKDLLVANPYFKKVGAASKFTKVDPAAAAALYDLSADFDTAAGLVVFEIDSADLDVNGGFSHFSINMADSSAGAGTVAKLATAVYILDDSYASPAYALDI